MNISKWYSRLYFIVCMSIITPASIFGNDREQPAAITQNDTAVQATTGKEPVQPTEAIAPQDMPSEQELHTLYQEILEQPFNQVLAQVHLLDSLLEDLAFNIANNQAVPTKNRSLSISKIRSMRELLADLKNTQYVVLNEPLVNSFILIVHATTIQIKKALETCVDNLELPNLDDLLMHAQQERSFEEMQKELAYNDTLIKKLTKLADNLGLHWYNKVYRNFKHYILDPAKTVAPWALGTGIVAGAGFFLWYYSDMENPKWLRDIVKYPAVYASQEIINDPNNTGRNPVMKHLYDYVGACISAATQKLAESRVGLTTENPTEIASAVQQQLETSRDNAFNVLTNHPTGFLGRMEARLKGFMSGDYALGTFFLSTATLLGKDYLPDVGTWVATKAKNTDNFLMGGAYKYRSAGSYMYSSDITFDNIIGQEDAKEYGRQLCLYFKNPELFDRAKTTPSTGILLFGDTRTGKSYYISALFGEIKKTLGADGAALKMHKISFDAILECGINHIMEVARYEAPIILVIEEIDLLGLQRTNNAKRLGEFMVAMSSCLQENTLGKTVIVIGTTNKLENLEPALRTDGRFGKHLFFDYPTFKERKECIERELIKTACDPKQFDIDQLARDTAGCSFEKIKYFIKRTFLRAKLYNETVNQEALERSVDENIRGISANEVTLDAEQKELIATHLAGHAVASILLDPHQKVSKVTLKDVATKIEEQYVGMTLVHKDAKQEPMEHGKVFANYDHDMPGIESKQEKIKQCKITLAGHVAETLLLGSCGYGYHPDDKQQALAIAKSITCGNLDLTVLTDKMRDQFYDEAFALMNRCEKEVTQLLEEHRAELVATVEALIGKLTLSAKQLRALILGEQEPKKEHLDASRMLDELLKSQPALAEQFAAVAKATPAA